MKFRERRRQNFRAALRWSARLFLLAVALRRRGQHASRSGRVRRPLCGWDHLPTPPKGFGRTLYKLEALSPFESADPLQTRKPPVWHDPRHALAVVDQLLGTEPQARVHLEYLREALVRLSAKGARFYFLVKTWGGGTNARVEALRHGDMSVIAPR